MTILPKWIKTKKFLIVVEIVIGVEA